jgi:hypothetical protein
MIWLALLACDGDGRNPDAAGPACVDTETPVGVGEETALGVTADEVAALVAPASTYPFTWADGASTTLTLSFVPTDEAWFVDSEPAPRGDGETPAIWIECDDRLELRTRVGFTTADGAFDESWDERLVATGPGSATLHHTLDLGGLAGSFAIDPFVEAVDHDELRAWTNLQVTAPGESHGAVEGQASGQDDCAEGDECAAWAEMVPIATWRTATPSEP